MKRCIIFLLIAMIIIMQAPVSAQAKITNAKAHKKYQKKMESVYEKFKAQNYLDNTRIRYAYADLNGDKTDEMLVFDEGNPYSHGMVYSIVNGKVKLVLDDFSLYVNGSLRGADIDLLYYSSAKMITCESSDELESIEYLYVWNGKKYKVSAKKCIDGTDQKPTEYYVNGKKTSEKKYNSFINSKIGSLNAGSAGKLKWYDYAGNDPLIRFARSIESAGKLVIEAGSSLSIPVEGETGNLNPKISVSDKTVANAEYSWFGLWIKGEKAGETTVTLESSGNKVSFTIEVIKKGSDREVGQFGDELDNVTVAKAGKVYYAEFSFYRLCELDLSGRKNSDGELVLKGKDPSERPIEVTMKKSGNRYIAKISKTTWENFTEGETYEF